MSLSIVYIDSKTTVNTVGKSRCEIMTLNSDTNKLFNAELLVYIFTKGVKDLITCIYN